jgi:Zn-dependent peptidase ImmA (M78 family)
MKLISHRYTEIEEKANEIILKQKTVLPPFNPYIIAENLGIKVIRYSSLSDEYRSKMSRYFAFEENDAFSYINPIKNESKILVNDTIISSGRINFTIFHEIGHIILNHTEQSELAESEADVFACRIMMPYGIMRTIDEKDMNEDFIMEQFGASREAACNAIKRTLKRFRFHDKEISESTMRISERYLKLGGILCE